MYVGRIPRHTPATKLAFIFDRLADVVIIDSAISRARFLAACKLHPADVAIRVPLVRDLLAAAVTLDVPCALR